MSNMRKRLLPFSKTLKKYRIILAIVLVGALLGGFIYEAKTGREVPPKEVMEQARFFTTQEHTYDKRLYLHDYVTRKSYEVAHIDGRYDKWDWDDDGDVYTFNNPVVLGDHSVAYYALAEKRREKGKIGQPLNMEGTINITSLKTGKTKQILRNHAGDLPESLCCSVSPDGQQLAVPLSNGKLAIYSENGEKVKEMAINARVVPQLGERDKKNDYDLASLSQSYPLVRWLDDHRIILASGAPIQYSSSHERSIDTNSLSIIDINTGQQAPIAATNGKSIAWFDVWDNQVVFASYDGLIPNLIGGPPPGKVGIYTTALTAGTMALKINDLPFEIQDPLELFFDRTKATLYLQQDIRSGISGNDIDAAETITAINLSEGSRKSYSGVKFDVKGLVGSDTLVSEDRLVNESVGYTDKGSIYNLNSGKTEKIY